MFTSMNSMLPAGALDRLNLPAYSGSSSGVPSGARVTIFEKLARSRLRLSISPRRNFSAAGCDSSISGMSSTSASGSLLPASFSSPFPASPGMPTLG